jgi:hypothetical protein
MPQVQLIGGAWNVETLCHSTCLTFLCAARPPCDQYHLDIFPSSKLAQPSLLTDHLHLYVSNTDDSQPHQAFHHNPLIRRFARIGRHEYHHKPN